MRGRPTLWGRFWRRVVAEAFGVISLRRRVKHQRRQLRNLQKSHDLYARMWLDEHRRNRRSGPSRDSQSAVERQASMWPSLVVGLLCAALFLVGAWLFMGRVHG
jgi:hypothetical protein